MIRTSTLIFVSLLLSTGCVFTTGPKNDVGFVKVEDIQAFVGSYQNKGEGGQTSTPMYLSAVLWPAEKIDHRSIDVIRVGTAAADTLLITAESNGHPVINKAFVEGEDFVLKSGRIRIKQDVHMSLASPPGNPFIGLASETRTLGLDERGDGKLQDSSALAGTAFLIIPVVGAGRDNVRFQRIRDVRH